MEIPLLGREYAFPLLEVLEKRGQTTFTGLLTELKVSRATLSSTLQDLVEEGYVQKETLGKYSIYRLKEKGSQELTRRIGCDPLVERVAVHIYEKMKSEGKIDFDTEREEVLAAIREKAQQLIEQIANSASEILGEAREP